MKNSVLIFDESNIVNIDTINLLKKDCDLKIVLKEKELDDILNSGFSPSVILFSELLNNTSLAVVIKKTKKFIPNASRIIVTDGEPGEDVKSIVESGNALMYIPAITNANAFLQIIQSAIELYKFKIEKSKLASENKELNSKLNGCLKELEQIFPQSIQAISTLVNISEKYHFTSHSRSVTLIAKTLAEELEFFEDRIMTVVLSSLLFNSLMNGMPRKYILTEPFDMGDEEAATFFELFQGAVSSLFRVDSFLRHARIISNIWERNDGTGMPNGVPGSQLEIESQIISLAHCYHNAVYRLPKEQIEKLDGEEDIIQSSIVTMDRHDKFLKTLSKNPKQYDFEIFQRFHEIIKRNKCIALIPHEEDLKIKTMT